MSPETERRSSTTTGLGRDFWLFRLGQAISIVGDSCNAIALAWWILDATGSAAAMSAVLAPAPSGIQPPTHQFQETFGNPSVMVGDGRRGRLCWPYADSNISRFQQWISKRSLGSGPRNRVHSTSSRTLKTSGSSEAWYRARFGTERSRVRIPPSRPLTKGPS